MCGKSQDQNLLSVFLLGSREDPANALPFGAWFFFCLVRPTLTYFPSPDFLSNLLLPDPSFSIWPWAWHLHVLVLGPPGFHLHLWTYLLLMGPVMGRPIPANSESWACSFPCFIQQFFIWKPFQTEELEGRGRHLTEVTQESVMDLGSSDSKEYFSPSGTSDVLPSH